MRGKAPATELPGLLAIGKALDEEMRVRALAALAGGELCLCQFVDLLGLAPSTLSKHMSVLSDAGLVVRHKKGRWHYFRLPGPGASHEVRRIVAWVLETSGNDPVIRQDAKELRRILRKDPKEMSACYRN